MPGPGLFPSGWSRVQGVTHSLLSRTRHKCPSNIPSAGGQSSHVQQHVRGRATLMAASKDAESQAPDPGCQSGVSLTCHMVLDRQLGFLPGSVPSASPVRWGQESVGFISPFRGKRAKMLPFHFNPVNQRIPTAGNKTKMWQLPEGAPESQNTRGVTLNERFVSWGVLVCPNSWKKLCPSASNQNPNILTRCFHTHSLMSFSPPPPKPQEVSWFRVSVSEMGKGGAQSR